MNNLFKVITITLIMALLTGCSAIGLDKNQLDNTSSNDGVYISNDVDIFGNRRDGGDISENTNSDAGLYVHFIDVGQADAILVLADNGDAALIDGGNKDDGYDLLKYLNYVGVERLKFVIATHPHEDHIGGLITVLENIETDLLIAPYVPDDILPTTYTYEDFLRVIEKKEINAEFANYGDTMYIGGTTIKILSDDTVEEAEYGDLNAYSVVCMLEYGNTSFLLTGDATSTELNKIANHNNVHADVLKVGHHGSYTSTNDSFVGAVSPKYAVIMCGKNNDYGHPHKEAIGALDKYNVTTLSTSEDGTIVFSSDGNKLSYYTKATGEYSLGDSMWNESMISIR